MRAKHFPFRKGGLGGVERPWVGSKPLKIPL